MSTVAPIVCTGRTHDDLGHSTGEPCGKELHPTKEQWSWLLTDDLGRSGVLREAETAEQFHSRARAAGWAIGPNGEAMCPRCRRPDTRTLAALAEFGVVGGDR